MKHLLLVGMTLFGSMFATPGGAAEKTLTELLLEKAQAAADKSPPERRAIMEKALDDLRKTRIAEKAKRKGDAFPAIALQDLSGHPTSIVELAKKSPVVVAFYRGGWCPYCMLELKYWNEKQAEAKKRGVQFVAVTPEKPEEAKKTAEKQGWTFPVLIDQNSALARQLGIVYSLPPDLIEIYKGFGVDLAANNTTETWELPISATYAVGKSGKISFAHVDPDYKKRAEPATVLQAAGRAR